MLEAFGGSGELRGGRDNDLIELYDGTSFMANGNKGSDTLINYGGDNTLHGGQDNDILASFGGVSTMYGDKGSDTFVFYEDGFGLIIDFQNGVDQLNFANLSNVSLSTNSEGTEVINNGAVIGFI